MKPILFNTEMVRAILEGRKTQTRRIIKLQPPKELQFPYGFITGSSDKKDVGKFCWTVGEICDGRTHNVKPPYQSGDILWVRETWQNICACPAQYAYKADGEFEPYSPWKPSIHMPREAARIFLKVTNVRVERLQDISFDDAIAEGMGREGHIAMGISIPESEEEFNLKKYPERLFKRVWEGTIKKFEIDKYGWNANPWVWVYEFERVSEDGSSNTNKENG